MRFSKLLLALLLLPLVASAQTTIPLTGMGSAGPVAAGGGGGCLMLEDAVSKILLEDLSGCVALEP